MRLEQLHTDILEMAESELMAFIIQYTNKRAEDLSKPTPAEPRKKTTPKIPSKKEKSISLTTEQIELLKKLNLI